MNAVLEVRLSRLRKLFTEHLLQDHDLRGPALPFCAGGYEFGKPRTLDLGPGV